MALVAFALAILMFRLDVDATSLTSQKTRARTMYDSKIGCRSSMPKLKFRKKSIHQMEKIPSITPGVMQVMDLQEVADPTALLEKKKYLKQRDEFLLNKGRLIDNIQFEIPRITDKAPSLDLIREDVRLQLEFEKIGLEFEVSGKQSYKTWFERLRWTSRLALGWVEVSQCKIRPDIDPMSRYVRCRWSVTAYPRLFMQSAPIRIDLLSIFELDGRGYVKKHEITDVEESSVQIPAVLRSLFVASPAMMDPVPMQSVTNESPISGQY